MMISRFKHRSSIDVCADCGASDPSWASINRGLLLCAECCSVHRSMGRHISHVKSLRQGTWPPSLLAMVQALTAQNVNSIWEHSLLDTAAPKHLRKKPQPKDPLHPTKSEFILAKHLRLAYVLRARRDEPPSELGRQLHSAVRSSSLDTAMRLLAQGADPNYYNQACQPAQAELLMAWGADPNARDAAGNTPAECARQGGHIELAERMVELVYEATDRLIYFLTGERPEHSSGRHYIVPRPNDTHQMTDVAKAARGKLQLLPNHLFEELVMDIYDEVDRRETEAIWQTSATGLERCGVVFLPVNPALSAPRNQGRQKLARLSAAEMAALLRDVLVDATRRQHIATLQPRALGLPNPLLSASHLKHTSQVSDDEPLYDSVASDDDYAALAPIDIDMSKFMPKMGEAVSILYNPSLPTEQSAKELRNTQSQNSIFATGASAPKDELESLRKELDNRDSTISELKTQLKNLQSIVEQLTKENSVLKTSVDDTQSIVSITSTLANDSSASSNTEFLPKIQERGKSMETDQLINVSDEAAEIRSTLKSTQRPVSMYETREGPKNNWQVTKHQLTTLSGLDCSLTQSVLDGTTAITSPTAEAVHRGAEAVTRAIQELWAAAREQRPSDIKERAEHIRRSVRELLALFPQTCSDIEVNTALVELRAACDELYSTCVAGAPVERLRAAAYELAKATKLLVTHYNIES
ncbi:ARF GTPase-activating protein GIT2 [Eumeta japonica]|uniref:ARF GTPase-activating protein GIT2 n=1 Tax=Eumeta variegata TaxID=151549 RepID=A0A4C1XU53_EUMVA|nr:ARF GTPase-activating protein GIT2 [Eumeta japonica]